MRLKKLFTPYLALSRPLWVLFFVQVINRMGNFIAPFLTLLLTRQLGQSDAEAGLWITATVLSGVLGILASGKASDRWGRKPVLVAGMGFSAVLIAAGGFGPHNPRIVWIILAMSFFQGMVSPAIAALIADLTKPEERKDAYALNYLGINVGVAVGPMIAGFLFEHSIAWLFWLDALSSCAALSLIFAYIPKIVPHALTHHASSHNDERIHEGSALAEFFRRHRLVLFCLILMVVNMVTSQTHFALPLYTGKRFDAQGALIYGWIMSVNALTVVTITPLASHLTRRQRPLVSMSWGTLFYCAGFLMMALPLEIPLLLVSTCVWTLGEIWFSINTGVYMASKTPANLRGQFHSYREFISSIGRMSAPLLGGFLIAGAGIYVMWVATAALGLAAVAGFIHLDLAERRKTC